ncbi:nuclear transport factor 2 family protein [Tatumella sp. UBA2305]|uniref:nuclear transport factor 2 family protein n=1 Tax=Tatumella sp. UBA2305 TaxID=1947647 RepID=UPI0025D1E870|nr:nuclear transport factor 2 family protein [Tatumella sp. UBA2305]
MKKIFSTMLLATSLLTGAHDVCAEETSMNTEATQTEPAGLQQLIDHHFALWNNPHPAERAAKFPEVYTADFFIADENGLNQGMEQVNAAIGKVQSLHSGFIFTPAPVQWNHGIARVSWGYGPANHPFLVRGEDIFTVSHNRLSSARVFLQK